MEKTKKIQIKDLEIGMKIKTKDVNGNIIFKTVTDKFDTVVPSADQVRLEFENGTILNCSINHPIMIWNELEKIEQKNPQELSKNDRILTDQGFTKLLTIDVGQNNDENYIDITVDDEHTFFASNSDNGEMILTHNSQGGIRNACVSIESYVDVLDGFEFNGVEYYRDQIININDKQINITDVLSTLAYMGDINERETYLQNLFS